jgi:1-acyl-sn-glycerol-3-phosphate acyltransferase
MKTLRIYLTGAPILFRYSRFMKKASQHPENYLLTDRFEKAQALMRELNRKTLHATYIITGQDQVPQGQVLFVPNHVSLADPAAMIVVSDRPVGFLAKEDVKKIPVIGNTTLATDGIFIDRQDLRTEIAVFRRINELLTANDKLSYVIFAEGTRSKGPDFPLGDFHPGSFRVATKLSLPIVPVAMYLTDRMMNPHYHYHRYPIQVHYCKAILPSEYENMIPLEIATEVKARIAAALVELKAADQDLVRRYNGYSLKKTLRVLHYPR